MVVTKRKRSEIKKREVIATKRKHIKYISWWDIYIDVDMHPFVGEGRYFPYAWNWFIRRQF